MFEMDLELTKEEMKIYKNFLKTGKAPENKRQLGNCGWGYSDFYLDLRESGDVFLCEKISKDEIYILSMHDKKSNPSVFYGYTTTKDKSIKANIVLEGKNHEKTWIDKIKENWKPMIETTSVVAIVAATGAPYVGLVSTPFVYAGFKIVEEYCEFMSMKDERTDYVDRNKGRVPEEYRDPYTIIHDTINEKHYEVKIKEKPKDKVKEKPKTNSHEHSNYMKKEGLLVTLTKEEMQTYKKFLESDKPFSARLGTGLLKLHLCKNGTIVISEPADMDYGRRTVAIHDKLSNPKLFYGEHVGLYTDKTMYIPFEIVMENEESKFVEDSKSIKDGYSDVSPNDADINVVKYLKEEREVRYREQARFDKEADKMEEKLLQNMEIKGDKVLFHFRPEIEFTVHGTKMTLNSNSHLIYECSVSEKDIIATKLARTIVDTMTDNYASFSIRNVLTNSADNLVKQCKLLNEPLLPSEKFKVSVKTVADLTPDFTKEKTEKEMVMQ